jgi:hypothetical protein
LQKPKKKSKYTKGQKYILLVHEKNGLMDDIYSRHHCDTIEESVRSIEKLREEHKKFKWPE